MTILLNRDNHHVYRLSTGVLGFMRHAAADELHVAARPTRLGGLAVDRERQRARTERNYDLIEIVLVGEAVER